MTLREQIDAARLKSKTLSRNDLGRKCTVELTRDYGPYLDGKPILPKGTHDAVLTGMTSCTASPKGSDFTIKHDGDSYYVQGVDVVVLELHEFATTDELF